MLLGSEGLSNINDLAIYLEDRCREHVCHRITVVALLDSTVESNNGISQEEGLALIESIGEVEVIWIYKDGTVKYTDGIITAK